MMVEARDGGRGVNQAAQKGSPGAYYRSYVVEEAYEREEVSLGSGPAGAGLVW